MPNTSQVQPYGPLLEVLLELREQFLGLDEGDVATYIPELARAEPSDFAICLATVDGNVYVVGDSEREFTIQSISKPFAYGLALSDRGVDEVLAKVGVEPSGEAFNAISLEAGTGRPRNPMINAGAITTTSLISGSDNPERLSRLMDTLAAFAGRDLFVDETVFRSESETGHRNRAIGHLLRNAGILTENVDGVLETYFRQCSVRVTCRDLAVMGATLAASGQNPITGRVALSRENVERVLSVMSSCGMYDLAGSWIYRVGMPAKSGVSGGIMCVLPGQFGFGVYSPRLDVSGNSVRGVAVCEAISRRFRLHLLHPPLRPGTAVRTVVSLAEVRSKRTRPREELEVLDRRANRVKLIELQGRLAFSAAEVALHRAGRECSDCTGMIFDFKRVEVVDPAVRSLFEAFARRGAEAGLDIALAGLADAEAERALLPLTTAVHHFKDTDSALEWFEDSIISECLPSRQTQLGLLDHPLMRYVGADAPGLEKLLTRVTFAAGDTVITQGAAADSIFLVVSGIADVSLSLPDASLHRVSSVGPGSIFGEMALLDRGPRSAGVYAKTELVCYELTLEPESAFPVPPELKAKLVKFLAGDLADRLRRANNEIAALAT